MNTFNITNNGSTCSCPDSSFIISNSSCICPTLTTLYNLHCYSCNITYCTQCQQDGVCSACSAPFVVTNGTCACPATYVQQGN
jgi:hypothetical protein